MFSRNQKIHTDKRSARRQKHEWLHFVDRVRKNDKGKWMQMISFIREDVRDCHLVGCPGNWAYGWLVVQLTIHPVTQPFNYKHKSQFSMLGTSAIRLSCSCQGDSDVGFRVIKRVARTGIHIFRGPIASHHFKVFRPVWFAADAPEESGDGLSPMLAKTWTSLLFFVWGTYTHKIVGSW